MTTATFSATAPITHIPTFKTPKGLTTLGYFIAVFFGVNADKVDHFRGLDLNGNAMWSR
jgi:hypothetical protein